ncbi:MAG: hypothetical protein ACI4WS_09690 [Oscillospiraceae bacterium]
MNKSYSVGDLLSLYYENEFAAVEDAELPDFSAKHKRKMQRIFNLFEKNKARMDNSRMIFTAQSQLSFRKRLLFNVIIIVGLAFLAGCANALISKSLYGSIYRDIMNIFGYQMYIPDGYMHFSAQIGDKKVITIVNEDSNVELINPKAGISIDKSDLKQAEITSSGTVFVEFRVEN